MTIAIAILLFSWLCFNSDECWPAAPDNLGHNLYLHAKNIVKDINDYALNTAFFIQKHYDGHMHAHHKDDCVHTARELETHLVPKWMSEYDLDALLSFIIRTSDEIQSRRRRWSGEENPYQKKQEAKRKFETTMFGPSEDMIETIQNLTEQWAWAQVTRDDGSLDWNPRPHANAMRNVSHYGEKLERLFADKLMIITKEKEERIREKEQNKPAVQ
jgi:hypothetical protein